MVVHNAEGWLPRQLVALAGLNPRPGRLVAVDSGSTDGSAELLAKALAEGVVDDVITTATQPFGAAVAEALHDQEPEWIWLLHDDSAPRRDTLAHLVEGAKQADIVVPKLLEPKRRNYPETLSEVGQSITKGGLRVPLVEVGDIDQGQSESAEVLGASTAGLLIRGETWREVGGLAPEVERHRDGVDLCWRANAYGNRILTWPNAALTHRRAGHTGERESNEHPHVADRLAALRVVGARGASTAGLTLASVARAFGFLLAKSPSQAGAELKALRRYQSSAASTASLKDRLPAEDHTPPEFIPGRLWPVKHWLDKAGASITERYRDFTEPDTSIDELTGDDFTGVQNRRRVINPLTVLLSLLLVLSLIAGRRLYGVGDVAGGGLLPAPSTLGEAWQAYLTGEAPWLGIAASASVLGLGQPGWFTVAALVLTPVFAAWTMWRLIRRFEVGKPVAAALAGVWAVAVVLLGLVTAGDVTGMTLAVVGPLLASSLISVARNEAGGAERLRAPAVAAFWLLIVSAVWPTALILATVAGIGWIVRDRGRVVDVAVAVLPSWIFLAPWVPALVRHPGRLLTGVDPLAWPDYHPASWATVFGRILPSGLPLWANVAFFALLALVAAVALARLTRRAWVGVVVAVAAPLLIGTLLSRLVVEVDGGSARALSSPWALLVVAGLIAPIAAVQWGQLGMRRATSALTVAGLLAAGTWAVVGFNGPVGKAPTALPGYVRDVTTSSRDSRALMMELTPNDTVAWSVVDARQPQWGTGERNPAGPFAEDFAAIVNAIASGNPPDDLAERLRINGTSHVWVRGFGADHRVGVDNVAGMVSAPADDTTIVWTVSGLVSRAWLQADEDVEPIVDAQVPSGSGERTLVIAEPADANWRATVGGVELERADAVEERLAFALNGASGELRVEPAPHWWRFALHLTVFVALAILAAPTMSGPTGARRGLE